MDQPLPLRLIPALAWVLVFKGSSSNEPEGELIALPPPTNLRWVIFWVIIIVCLVLILLIRLGYRGH
jgi:hypothetical protein